VSFDIFHFIFFIFNVRNVWITISVLFGDQIRVRLVIINETRSVQKSCKLVDARDDVGMTPGDGALKTSLNLEFLSGKNKKNMLEK